MVENAITEKIIGCAIEVHRSLGPGLLENAYKHCLCHELQHNGLFVEMEKPMPLFYRDIRMDCGYRMDLFVENKVVVEIKTVTDFDDIHLAQMMTYLKLTNCKIGLLLNFNVRLLKDGIKRVII